MWGILKTCCLSNKVQLQIQLQFLSSVLGFCCCLIHWDWNCHALATCSIGKGCLGGVTSSATFGLSADPHGWKKENFPKGLVLSEVLVPEV